MGSLKQIVDRLRFRFWKLRDRIRNALRGKAHRQGVFARIYEQNQWKNDESRSGSGSSFDATENIRRELPVLFQQYGVRSLLDAPCGDFHWIRGNLDALDRYVGVDIVPELIERNSHEFGNDKIAFICADITVDPLPKADLVMCRDCFIHLPTRMILSALRNFRNSGARLILITNDCAAIPYHDIPVGSFRPINFSQPPFSFPLPLQCVNEDPAGSRQLCLWELDKLPLA